MITKTDFSRTTRSYTLLTDIRLLNSIFIKILLLELNNLLRQSRGLLILNMIRLKLDLLHHLVTASPVLDQVP